MKSTTERSDNNIEINLFLKMLKLDSVMFLVVSNYKRFTSFTKHLHIKNNDSLW